MDCLPSGSARVTASVLTSLLWGVASLSACADDGGAEAGVDGTDTGGATDDELGETAADSSSESGSDESESESGSDSESDSSSETSEDDTDGMDDMGDDTETGPQPIACAGHVELCARRFDEVVFPASHNSHAASSEGFTLFNTNQSVGVAEQLQAGIRGLLMDTYFEGGEVVLCHGPCGLGSTNHAEVLGDIVDFLDANPGELITIIYEDGVSPEQLGVDFESTGAIARVYAHEPGQPWPTLGEMVEADTRLVITAEQGGPPPAWHHNIWEIGWDTPYGPTSADDLSCALNRGSADNDLFLVNHWVNNAFGLPSTENADEVNEYSFLLARAQECEAMWDHAPNLLAVDFYSRGDVVAVAETLNGF